LSRTRGEGGAPPAGNARRGIETRRVRRSHAANGTDGAGDRGLVPVARPPERTGSRLAGQHARAAEEDRTPRDRGEAPVLFPFLFLSNGFVRVKRCFRNRESDIVVFPVANPYILNEVVQNGIPGRAPC